MGRRLKTLTLSICRPSSTCEETREFSQTCSEAELPTGDLRLDKESLVNEFSRNPSPSGAGTAMEGEGELREHEAAEDPLCVGGGIISRKKVSWNNRVRKTKASSRATTFYGQRRQLEEEKKDHCEVHCNIIK